jgi:glycosyltransferase involved in cell wall biosynthesis
LSFLRHACGAGWRVDAFCGEATDGQRLHGEELLSQVPAEARLHVFPASSRQPSYKLFPRVDGGFPNALEYARRAINLLATDPPDLVIASGPPFFTFVSALFVARHFGAALVLDYRDEWSECPFDFVHRDGHDRAWEQRCLTNADVVLFTTESHLRHQLATFPELAPQKAHVVPNGWEPDDFAEWGYEPPPAAPDEARPLCLAHVGTSAAHSSPQDFLDTLQQLLTDEPELVPQIRVQFIGRRSPSADRAIRNFGFPNVLEIIEHVGKREANRRMQKSDALLLIASKDLERYLPGKLFDYLAARRPVLVFGSAGESSALVDGLGAGAFCESGSPAALRDALLRLQRMGMPRDDCAIHEWLNEHRRDVLVARAFAIIESRMAADRSPHAVT